MGVLRGLACTIDIPADWWLDPPLDRATEGRVYQRGWDRRYTADEKKILEQAYIDNESDTIRFTYERGPANAAGQYTTGYVWKETDSDAIAWVIRQHIAKGGDFRFLTESTNVNTRLYRVGEVMYADTELGRKLAMEAMQETGQPMVPVEPEVE